MASARPPRSKSPAKFDRDKLLAFNLDALQGLAVSSHGQRRGAKYLFVVPGGGPEPAFDTTTLISTAEDPAEGWVDWDGTRRWWITRFGRR